MTLSTHYKIGSMLLVLALFSAEVRADDKNKTLSDADFIAFLEFLAEGEVHENTLVLPIDMSVLKDLKSVAATDKNSKKQMIKTEFKKEIELKKTPKVALEQQ